MNRINRIGVTTQADGSIDIVVPASMAEEFKQMCKRGTNTYPSKNSEITDFVDRLLGQEQTMGRCMKWDIPAEDKFELAVESLREDQIAEIKAIGFHAYYRKYYLTEPEQE
jgi:hypothetical protein